MLPSCGGHRVFPRLVYCGFSGGSSNIMTPRQYEAMLADQGGWVSGRGRLDQYKGTPALHGKLRALQSLP